MKNNLLEYIILYVLVASAALIIATLARIYAFSLGVDNFTAFIIFIVVLGIEGAAYLSIHVVLQGLMLPWIARLLLKIPYFKNKTKNTPPIDKITNPITEPPSLEDIRNEQLQNKAKEQEEKLNIALNYTRKAFAPYVSDGQIEVLCGNLQLYADKLNLEKLRSIKTSKDLSSVDISHFGWNIWNHFNVGKRIEIAHFLKRVFPDILKDVEVESIKSHLKDDELKGIIKIQKSLMEQ
ncbi:MAG: mobilization protein [Bacteroidota bacterium]|nr:mobilization protein [Bacteroidota bacterium]